jgi:hypothetical protein
LLNISALEGDGASSLPQGSGINMNRLPNVHRVASIVRAQRASNVVTCTVNRPSPLKTWQAGDIVTVAGMNTASFNATNVTLTAVDTNLGTFSFAQTDANATDANAGGNVTHSSTHTYKFMFPYNMRTRLIGGVLQAKQWAYGEAEPDWGDTLHVAQTTVGVGATSGLPTGNGQCGFFFGHARDVTYGEVGNVTITSLD